MSDEIFSPEVARHLYEVYGTDEMSDGDRAFAVLYQSHEAMRDQLDLFRGLAMRHIEGWHPQFHTDPAKCVWVSNTWPADKPSEPMTASEVEFYRQRREARR